MLYIYFKKPNDYFSKENIKKILRSFLGRYGGPQAVNDSLLRGLSDIEYNYSLNKNNPKFNKEDVIFVNNSINALKWAIDLKKNNKISKLIVGPNTVVSPNDQDGIILDNNIDLILFPSEWTKDFFCQDYYNLSKKIKIWPSGVIDCGPPNFHRDGFIIFYKNNRNLFNNIVDFFNSRNISYNVLEYGKFTREEYYRLLQARKYMVYISNSESQGIALQEAWIRDVPTFVWNRGYWENENHKWSDKKISSPYLDEKSGLFFSSFDDFKNKFDIFIESDFFARDYCLNNLTDRKSALLFVNYIKNI